MLTSIRPELERRLQSSSSSSAFRSILPELVLAVTAVPGSPLASMRPELLLSSNEAATVSSTWIVPELTRTLTAPETAESCRQTRPELVLTDRLPVTVSPSRHTRPELEVMFRSLKLRSSSCTRPELARSSTAAFNCSGIVICRPEPRKLNSVKGHQLRPTPISTVFPLRLTFRFRLRLLPVSSEIGRAHV